MIYFRVPLLRKRNRSSDVQITSLIAETLISHFII